MCTVAVMTTHSHTPQPPYARSHVSSAGDLVAAVPALLGFTPHRSLVLVCLMEAYPGEISIGTVMRHDLSLPPATNVRTLFGDDRFPLGSEMTDVIDKFAELCEREQVRRAVTLVVDDRAESTVDGSDTDRRFRAIAIRLSEKLQSVGTELTQAFVVADLVDGARWATLVGPAAGGSISDPETSPTALAYLVAGRPPLGSRDQLKRTVQPIDDEATRKIARIVERARSAQNGSDRDSLESVLGRLLVWAAAPPDSPAFVTLSRTETAEFGLGIRRVMVRDSLLAITLTGLADIAEQLWLYLARMLPAPERSTPATLLAFSAYARGDGVLAAVAVEVALEADPDYSLATLLDRSLSAGARPEMIREVAASGYAVAELCGVRLPPPVD